MFRGDGGLWKHPLPFDASLRKAGRKARTWRRLSGSEQRLRGDRAGGGAGRAPERPPRGRGGLKGVKSRGTPEFDVTSWEGLRQELGEADPSGIELGDKCY